MPDGLEHALAGRAQQQRERQRVLGKAAGALLLDERVGLVREQRLALPDRHDSSIGAASTQEASRSSASARAAALAGSSMPAVTPTVTSPA